MRRSNSKSYSKDVILLCCLVALIVTFFLPLLYPTQRLFVTPDSYLSDISHLNIPLKHFLSESIKRHSLPLWSDAVGEGFPVLSQGETGSLNMINLILFSIFPFVTAFNLTYVITFCMFAIGMYFVAREFSLSRFVAFFCASIFTFTGFHIVQIPHMNHLQTFSYFPFIFWIWIRMIHHPRSRIWLLAPFIFSQQIFAGHYQYIYMEVVFFFLFIVFSYRKFKTYYASLWPKYIIVLLLTVLLSAVQLLPTYEFFTTSDRNQNILTFNRSTFSAGIGVKEFVRAINPNILGDLKNGSYTNPQSAFYWESLFFIGILPLILFFTSFNLIKKSLIVKIFIFIFFVLFILSMDMKSPIYLLFSFPPFSWFRFQSRFIAYMSFLAILLAGFSLEALTKRIRNHTVKICVLLVIIGVSVLELFLFGRSYNPTLDAHKILDMPEFLTSIHTAWPYRMHALLSDAYWRKQLYTNGWKNLDTYTYFLNHGTPNYPMIGHIPSLTVYSGITQKKQSYLERLLDVSKVNSDKEASLSASAINIFSLHAVKDIITSSPLVNKEVALVRSTKPPSGDLPVFYHYVLNSVKPIYYMARKIAPASSYDEYKEYMKDPKFFSTYDAVITGPVHTQQVLTQPHDDIQILSKQPTRYSYRTSNDTDGYFVQSTYFYPGWEAQIDGKPTEIYPANLTGMSVYLPKGTHAVSFTFKPKSLWYGMAVSTIGILGYAILIIVCAKNQNPSPSGTHVQYPRHRQF